MRNNQENQITADFGAKYQGVSAIVLGATGFIGRWVARALCECGAKVHLVVRNRQYAETIFAQYGIRGSIVEMDLTSAPEMFEAHFQEINPAITFNLAGYGIDRSERDEMLSQKINRDLVQTLCTAIAKRPNQSWPGLDLVHAGSALEYGTIDGDLVEDSRPVPTTLYGQSKLAGTRILSDCNKSGHMQGMTARLFTVYGPGEHAGRLLPALIESAGNGQPLDLTAGLQKRDFTYVGDVAEGLLRIGSTGSSGSSVVNLATGQLQTVREFTESAADVLGIPRHKLNFGAIPTRVEEMRHAPVANQRLKQLTGWVPQTGVREGIRRTISVLQGCG